MSKSAVINSLNKVTVEISVVLGHSKMPIRHLLKMGRGAVIDLEARHEDQMWIYGNDELIARGDVVVVGDKIGVTITEMIDQNSDL